MGTRFSSSLFENFQLKNFPKVPSALTATATPRVKEDIIKELGLKEPQLLRNRLQGKILLTWFLKWKINSFESNKFLEKHPILHNLCPKQKVLYRNFIPIALF
jgi:ATP-dependent DNA helicase RecQ